MACERADGDEIELVAKFSGSNERGVAALVAESIAAMLAADLGLPVPEPFLVGLDPALVATIPDEIVADIARRSSPVAFGSKRLPSGYNTWPVGKAVPKDALAVAADIFAFDALIANADRRPENPNCLFQGTSLAIFDHELAFMTDGVVGWRPPWEIGALEPLRRPRSHLFADQLRGRALNFDRLEGAWMAVSNARLAAYRKALPDEWAAGKETIDHALSLIVQVRDNLGFALQEVMRVLR